MLGGKFNWFRSGPNDGEVAEKTKDGNSFVNHGNAENQPYPRCGEKLSAKPEAKKAAEKANGRNSSVNHGNRNQSGSRNTNSDADSGNDNSRHMNNNNGSGPVFNNSGKFTGHSNGSYIHGNVDASTRN